MVDWRVLLKDSPINWLLEESNPSVRYFTLLDILDRKRDDAETSEARKRIPTSTAVMRILENQHSQGYWKEPDSPYLPKYKASYWTVMTLAQLGMDGTNENVRKACEHVFRFQTKDGAFLCQTKEELRRLYDRPLASRNKPPSRDEWVSSHLFEQQLSCLTGNISAALMRIGYENDPRVKKALEWLIKIQNRDGGWLCPY